MILFGQQLKVEAPHPPYLFQKYSKCQIFKSRPPRERDLG